MIKIIPGFCFGSFEEIYNIGTSLDPVNLKSLF